MFAVLAEGDSDFETLAVIIKRIYAQLNPEAPRFRVGGKGFGGGAKLLKNGGGLLKSMHETGNWSRYVICHDADDQEPEERKAQVIEKIIRPARLDCNACALVPVRELESWILADINCLSKVFGKWRNVKDIQSPESIESPKEYLEHLCQNNGSPKYSEAFNYRIAEFLDFDKVLKKCPSFSPLVDIIKIGC